MLPADPAATDAGLSVVLFYPDIQCVWHACKSGFFQFNLDIFNIKKVSYIAEDLSAGNVGGILQTKKASATAVPEYMQNTGLPIDFCRNERLLIQRRAGM